MNTQNIIEILKETLEKDIRVKACYKFQWDKALQIQLHNGDIYNIFVAKLNKSAYKIRRYIP